MKIVKEIYLAAKEWQIKGTEQVNKINLGKIQKNL